MKNNSSQQLNNLYNAILSLENIDEAKRFFRDLLTEKELQEFSKRLQAAKMLSENSTYTQIEEITGLSSTTIARISKWLNGRQGGYKLMFDKLNQHSHHNQSPGGKGLC